MGTWGRVHPQKDSNLGGRSPTCLGTPITRPRHTQQLQKNPKVPLAIFQDFGFLSFLLSKEGIVWVLEASEHPSEVWGGSGGEKESLRYACQLLSNFEGLPLCSVIHSI